MKADKRGLLLNASLTILAGAMAVPALAQDVQDQTVATTAATADDGQTPDPKTAAEIIVTGSRLTTGFQAPTPITTVTAETIQQRAPKNIFEVVSEQPAFKVSSGDSGRGRFTASQLGAQATLDLRGLDPVRTLVLINGQRRTPTNFRGTFDVSLIPIALVDRVDVVTGGASAAYGSDAVAGAVNFVLKNHFEGVSATAQYGLTRYGDGGTFTGSLATGTSFADGRGHIITGIDYQKAQAQGTFYSRDYGAVEPGLVTQTAAAALASGTPLNIFANNAEYGLYTNGGLIIGGLTTGGTAATSAQLGSLLNTNFSDNGTPQSFAAGTIYGIYMLGSTANYGAIQGGYQPLANASERLTGFSRLEYEATPGLTLFAEIGAAKTHMPKGYTTPFLTQNLTGGGIRVNLSNPFLPTAIRNQMIANGVSTITIGKIVNEIGTQYSIQDGQWYSARFGANGKIGGSWRWNASAQRGRYVQSFDTSGLLIGNLIYAANGCSFTGPNSFPTAFPSSQVNTAGCVAFNPFGQQNSAATLDYISDPQHQDIVVRQDVVSANLSGALFDLPGGPLSVATGLEYRRDALQATAREQRRVGYFLAGNFTTFGGISKVTEGYVELGAPVLRDVWGINLLELNGAIRRTHYSLSGNVTTWKLGGVYEPVDGLRFRATRSQDIRAPNLNELFFVGGGRQGAITNNIPGTVGYGISAQTSNAGYGNTQLTPETARTLTFGTVLQPKWQWSHGIRLSVDYYRIRITNLISQLAEQATVDACGRGDAVACGAVTLDPTRPNGLGFVRAIQFNLGTRALSGIDFELAYQVPMASSDHRLGVRLLVNHAIKDVTTTTTTVLNSVGYASGVPDWRANVTLNYGWKDLTAMLQLRAFTAIRYSNTLFGPDDPSYATRLATASLVSTTINQNLFPGAAYLNLGLQYQVTSNVQMFGNIDNLLDKQPPQYALFAFTNANSSAGIYDLAGRSYRGGIRVNF